MKIGDTVRYLNDVGGGVVTRIDGKIAFVDDNGFETPVLVKDLVVVMPAGHQPEIPGVKKMFDQKAFDAGRVPEPAHIPAAVNLEPEENLPVEETEHGEKMTLVLSFEPDNLKNLPKSRFDAVLINDSNYFLDFTFLRRADEERGWSVEYRGTVAPNEQIVLAQFDHESLPQIERVALQAVPYKRDKCFTMKPPVNVQKRLDLTKFYKLHCFRPGLYNDLPVLDIKLMNDDEAVTDHSVKVPVETLSQKFKVENRKSEDDKRKKKSKNPADNPYKLLPPIEIDLHAGELLDTTAGLSNGDILQYQLDTVRKTMERNKLRKGQKIIFIHGKGEGVLRKEVLNLLRRQYPKAELQDASFQEYGFGATLVTVH
ncbi:MAG: DUF2027 domain-containing protein [Prevotella sp.]|nr:DUF2027 domain-containing protein [Bacteroides sp.]MCM1365745.1 DUF2027 domain-containing protein [Prevotella sp.]MCM1436415.1 DUF2027 domain-containing protein [Prevotella sp.]